MAYCRFCGKDIGDGPCNCVEFQASIGNPYYTGDGEQSHKKKKDPFVIPIFKPNFSSFSSFMSSIRDLSGMSEASSASADPYERDVPIVPDCIEAEENEIVVKQYNLAKLRTRLKFMKAEGRLMVTNRRVLFRAAGVSLTGNLVQEHQFNIDEIGGIAIHKDYKFSFLNLFGCLLLGFLVLAAIFGLSSRISGAAAVAICCILGVLAVAPTFFVFKRFGLKFLGTLLGTGFFWLAYAGSVAKGYTMILMIIAAIAALMNMVIVCFVPNLVFKIKTKGATEAILIGSQKSMFRRHIGDDYSGFTEVLPWEDTIMAMNELGTMIDDLQKNGDYAIEKWSR